ncbi:EamA family transporter [Actinomyces radicidentis]|uniref:EamA family transporter n=1 Tax=Actinomyces radicidentis TaxID=111015 RepID=UPI00349FF441
MFLGYVLFGVGLARVPASTATTITLLEPAVAALLAVAVLGERLTVLSWAGLALLAVVLVVLVTGPANGDGTTP